MIIKKYAISNRHRFRRVYFDIHKNSVICELGCKFGSHYTHSCFCNICNEVRPVCCWTTTLERSHYTYIGDDLKII